MSQLQYGMIVALYWLVGVVSAVLYEAFVRKDDMPPTQFIVVLWPLFIACLLVWVLVWPAMRLGSWLRKEQGKQDDTT